MQACIKQGLGGGVTQLLQTIRSGLAAVEAQVEAEVAAPVAAQVEYRVDLRVDLRAEVHAEVPAEVPAEAHVDRSGGFEACLLIQRERTQHLKTT